MTWRKGEEDGKKMVKPRGDLNHKKTLTGVNINLSSSRK